jgi:hypothetical protein
MELTCDKGHNIGMIIGNFKSGSGCSYCRKQKMFSIGEKNLYGFVKTIYSGIIDTNNRKIIRNPNTNKPMELDICMTEIKKALEYSGYH